VGKYSDEELSEMAMEVIVDQADGGIRSFQVIMSLSLILSVEPNMVFDQICKLVIR